MSTMRSLVALLVTGLGLSGLACGDESSPGTPSTGGGAGKVGAGGTPEAGQSSGGSSSVAGNGGSSGVSAGTAGQGTAGTGGSNSGGRDVMGARYDLCMPACDRSAFCALVDAGCGAAGPCLLEAECRSLVGCSTANDFMCEGLADHQLACGDDPTDDCDTVDCPGLCFCKQTTSCRDGLVFDENPAVCRCVPRADRPTSCLNDDCPSGFECELVMMGAVCVRPATQ